MRMASVAFTHLHKICLFFSCWQCLIIGAGPCGLRTAIELALLGAKVVLVEKRDAFSRNNVLHLWPFTIQDLRGLGAKKFYGKFCAGAIDHISEWEREATCVRPCARLPVLMSLPFGPAGIRQLQLMLLKMALLLGIEIHVNVEFKGLIEPPEDQESESEFFCIMRPRRAGVDVMSCWE